MAENNNIPLVSICCITYNHAAYIRQCIDGFIMQKTNFPFEIIIHDDCSTDGTVDIISEYQKKYPDLIKPIFQKENQYSQGIKGIIATFVYPKCSGKYIALCEGDDYWIDENKLQMQVDFLEKNSEYGMCYTQARFFYQSENEFSKNIFGNDYISFENLLLNGNVIPTLTTCFKVDLYKKYLDEIKPGTKDWLMGDYPMWLYFAKKSKLKFVSCVTSTYRVLENSASHSTDVVKQIEFTQSTMDIQKFYCDRYGVEYNETFGNGVKRQIYYSFLKKEYNRNIAIQYLSFCKKLKENKLKILIKKILYKNKFTYKILKIIKRY